MYKTENSHKYDDIIDLPHHTSPTRPRMSAIDRAAQFSPFAALTGYDAAVKETARLTDAKIELGDDKKSVLNEKLMMVVDCLDQHPEITVTYFEPDRKKAGGAYVSVTGVAKRIDEYKKELVLTDGTRIPIGEIYDISGDMFGYLEQEGLI